MSTMAPTAGDEELARQLGQGAQQYLPGYPVPGSLVRPTASLVSREYHVHSRAYSAHVQLLSWWQRRSIERSAPLRISR